MRHYAIAIDGPAGAGKSTIARRIASLINYIYVDTGAMYRAIAVAIIERGIDYRDEAVVSGAVNDIIITIRYDDGLQQVIADGENVTGKIRTEEVSAAASVVSSYPAVRKHLLDLQRSLAAQNNVVMDGRDIGTCILPDADLKIFLTASPEVRAERRYKELRERGEECSLDEIEKDITERDERDSSREAAPLKKAEDAVEIDSSDLDIDEVTGEILRAGSEKGLKMGQDIWK